MNRTATDSTFSVPYEIAVARPLRQTSVVERTAALRAAHYNTELIPQDMIYVDLCTDSGVSAPSTDQCAAMAGVQCVEPGMGLAPEGSRAHALLVEPVRQAFGFPHFVATTQGRAAERIWTKIHVKPSTVVAGNMLFPSTRAHIEMNGAKVIDVIGNDAHDLQSSAPFKGNLDLAKLEGAIREHGADKVSCIYVELAVNACGGHPVALGNLKAVKAVATAHKIPLYLDACRVLENSYLIKEREAGYQDRTILDIVRDTSALADACTMSALKDLLVPSGGLILMRDVVDYQKSLLQSFLDGAQLSGAGMEQMAIALKEIFASDAYLESRVEQVRYLWQRLVDEGLPVLRPSAGHAVYIDVKSFLPHLGPGQFPAEALAAFLYQRSGIRVTKGPPAAPSQAGRGVELLRLAVPARKYLNGHLDDVARALLNAHRQRNQIKGLNRIEDPSRSKYQPAQFEPL